MGVDASRDAQGCGSVNGDGVSAHGGGGACPEVADLSMAVPAAYEDNVQVLRALPVDLPQCLYGISLCSPGAETYFLENAAPKGIPNLGDTCFVSAVAQIILRVEPLAKVLDAHRQGCRVRPCGVCTVAAQCRILRHRGKQQGCPLATAARNGVFGNVFKRGQQDARMFLSELFSYLCRREPCVEDLLGMPDFATEYGARSVLDDCLFGCVFSSSHPFGQGSAARTRTCPNPAPSSRRKRRAASAAPGARRR